MARLWSSGFELNSLTNGVEYEQINNISISTTTVRSGIYALKLQPTTILDSQMGYEFSTVGITISYYRIYFRIEGFGNLQTNFFEFFEPGYENQLGSIRVNSSGVVTLHGLSGVQIGDSYSSLSQDVWYCVELKIDTTTLSAVSFDVRINDNSVITGTQNWTGRGKPGAFVLIGEQQATPPVYYADDIAINDSSGSSQNSWPGAENIIHLNPNAAGDANQWRKQNGDAGDTNNYTLVDEITPDDITTNVRTALTLNHVDDYNLTDTPVAIGSGDTINVVQVGVRFSTNGAGAGDNFQVGIKASSGGTVENSANILPTSTTYATNAVAAPRNYALTLYDLPGTSTTAWTKADLDTAQLQLKTTQVDDEVASLVSTVWLLVGYTPVSVANDLSDVTLRNESLRLLKVGK